MISFKKDLACNITLIAVLTVTVLHFILLTLNLFGVTNFALPANFNYIVAYVLIAVSLIIYVLSFFTCYLKRITFPTWLRISFYIALFLFTNTYYICGFMFNVVAEIFLFAYAAFLISVVAVSVFYNIQKDEKYRLKSSRAFICYSIFFYALGGDMILEILASIIKVLANGGAYASLEAALSQMCTMLLTTIIMTALFYMSLKKNKKFINACLVKTFPTKQKESNEN